MAWEVIHSRDYGSSVTWRHILKRCESRAEAVAWAKDYRARNPFGYPANEIYVENSDGPHERLALIDLLSEQAEE